MKLRNTKSLICFAIISSLFLGCTVVSEPETTQTIDQSSTSAVEAPPAANAAAPSTDKDDPAAATKTVEVKAGEPLLDVKASGGYFTGGILTKNGLSEADLGSVLTNPANAGVIGTRCSVSIPMKAMSDALMDRLDGGTATDTSALRGSANFFGVGCIGTPDYRVAKTGTLIVPDHGRKELGAQLAGTKSNLARLGEEVGAQGTKIDKLIRALETNNARIAKLSDDAKVEEKKAAEAWGKIYAAMAFFFVTCFLLSVVYVLYHRRHPKRTPVEFDLATKERLMDSVKVAVNSALETHQPAPATVNTDHIVVAVMDSIAKSVKEPLDEMRKALAGLTTSADADTIATSAAAAAKTAVQEALGLVAETLERLGTILPDLVDLRDNFGRGKARIARKEAELAEREAALAAHEQIVIDEGTEVANNAIKVSAREAEATRREQALIGHEEAVSTREVDAVVASARTVLAQENAETTTTDEARTSEPSGPPSGPTNGSPPPDGKRHSRRIVSQTMRDGWTNAPTPSNGVAVSSPVNATSGDSDIEDEQTTVMEGAGVPTTETDDPDRDLPTVVESRQALFGAEQAPKPRETRLDMYTTGEILSNMRVQDVLGGRNGRRDDEALTLVMPAPTTALIPFTMENPPQPQPDHTPAEGADDYGRGPELPPPPPKQMMAVNNNGRSSEPDSGVHATQQAAPDATTAAEAANG